MKVAGGGLDMNALPGQYIRYKMSLFVDGTPSLDVELIYQRRLTEPLLCILYYMALL